MPIVIFGWFGVVLFGLSVGGSLGGVGRSSLHAYPVFFVVEVGSAFVQVFLGSVRSAVFIAITAHPICYYKQYLQTTLSIIINKTHFHIIHIILSATKHRDH